MLRFIPVLIIVTLIWAWIARAIRAKKMRDKNYEAYLKDHPESLKGGRVHCHNCDSDRISVQKVMERMYMRAHVCAQCGTTLYYSSEERRGFLK